MTVTPLSIDAKLALAKICKAVSNQQPIKEKFNLPDGYAINLYISDYSKPLLFTFDNLHISRNMEGTTFDHRKGWGYEYIVNKGWNICTFLESDYTRWYSHCTTKEL